VTNHHAAACAERQTLDVLSLRDDSADGVGIGARLGCGITDGQLRIYVEVIGNWPTFFEYTKGTDFLKGPAGGRGAITHNELLGSLTPKELYGSGGISAGELLQGAVVNWLGQLVIKKGLKEISEARSSDEIARIRARIDRELEALKGGR
jgi:hypothetical protein